jgi:hypothetical protein
MSSKIVFGVALALASLLLANIGSAEGAPSLREGPWPIRNGHDYQPTEHELRALHEEDVTPGQAREIDRLYKGGFAPVTLPLFQGTRFWGVGGAFT